MLDVLARIDGGVKPRFALAERVVVTRRPSALVALCFATAMLAGCSDPPHRLPRIPLIEHQGTEDQAKWVGAPLMSLDNGPSFGPETARCVGHSVIDAMGVEPALALVGREDDTTEAEEAVVMAGLEECITGGQIAILFTSLIAEEFGVRDVDLSELYSCIEDHLVGQVGRMFELVAASDSSGSEELPNPMDLAFFEEVFDGCPTAKVVARYLEWRFVAETGLPPEGAKCVAGTMSLQMDLADVFAMGRDPSLEAAYEAPLKNSVRSCGDVVSE